MDSITLDALDWRILHALQVHARAPFNTIASVLGTSDQTVARRYRRLRSGGILTVRGERRTADDASGWIVRLRCTPGNASAIAEALARRPDTRWVLLASGGTEIVFVLRDTEAGARGEKELILNTLNRTPGITSVDAHSPLKFFVGRAVPWLGRAQALTAAEVDALQNAGAPIRRDSKWTPDSTDEAIMAGLAEDGRIGVSRLAARLALSETTIRRRLESLVASGRVDFEVTVDEAALGFSEVQLLWLRVPPTGLEALGTRLAGHRPVAMAAAVTGPYNVAAIVVCRDRSELYDYLTGELAAATGDAAFETSPVLRTVKRT